jgi:hypothetical protein
MSIIVKIKTIVDYLTRDDTKSVVVGDAGQTVSNKSVSSPADKIEKY